MFYKGYRSPRELTWVTGFVLLLMTMGFGFSGYLLPWDMVSLAATKIGTDAAKALGPLGVVVSEWLRGSDDVTGVTIGRFFALHVWGLPLSSSPSSGLHLFLVQLQGVAVPPSVERKGKVEEIPFFPNVVYRDLTVWLVLLGLLITLTAAFPWGLGDKADPHAPDAGKHQARVVLPLRLPDAEALPGPGPRCPRGICGHRHHAGCRGRRVPLAVHRPQGPPGADTGLQSAAPLHRRGLLPHLHPLGVAGMKPFAWLSALLLLPSTTLAAAPEPPAEPMLGQPLDRLLYVLLVWAVIIPLVVVIRDRCRVADDLFRMGHTGKPAEGKAEKRG